MEQDFRYFAEKTEMTNWNVSRHYLGNKTIKCLHDAQKMDYFINCVATELFLSLVYETVTTQMTSSARGEPLRYTLYHISSSRSLSTYIINDISS